MSESVLGDNVVNNFFFINSLFGWIGCDFFSYKWRKRIENVIRIVGFPPIFWIKRRRYWKRRTNPTTATTTSTSIFGDKIKIVVVWHLFGVFGFTQSRSEAIRWMLVCHQHNYLIPPTFLWWRPKQNRKNSILGIISFFPMKTTFYCCGSRCEIKSKGFSVCARELYYSMCHSPWICKCGEVTAGTARNSLKNTNLCFVNNVDFFIRYILFLSSLFLSLPFVSTRLAHMCAVTWLTHTIAIERTRSHDPTGGDENVSLYHWRPLMLCRMERANDVVKRFSVHLIFFSFAWYSCDALWLSLIDFSINKYKSQTSFIHL